MPERFTLVIEAGPRAGERVPIAGDRFTVGRKPGNSLVLADASVSGSHCEIRRSGASFVLKDLGSTNGTFFGGAKVLEAKINVGDQFALGSVLMRIEGEVDEIDLGGDAPVASGPRSASSHDSLELVEDEPAPAAAPQGAAPGARATAVAAPQTTTRVASAPSDSAVVTDAGIVERARRAAEAAAKQGRLSTLLIAVAAVAALGVGGYFAFFAGSGASGVARLRPIPWTAANLIPRDGSTFESASEEEGTRTPFRWQLRDASFQPAETNDTDAAASELASFAYTSKTVHTGARAIEARLDGEALARATSDPVAVGAGQSVKFAVQAACGARAGAAIQVVFGSRSDPTLRVVRCGAMVGIGEGSGKSFHKIEGLSLVPSGCNQASVSLLAFGKDDSVAFDDVELLPSTEAAPPSIVKNEIEFEADALDGRIRKISRDFVRDIGVQHRDAAGALRRVYAAGRSEKGAWHYVVASGDAGILALTLEPKDTSVVYHYQWESPAGGEPGKRPWAITWGIDRAYAPEILVRGAKSTGRFRGELREPAATALVFGEERDRLRLTFDPPTAVRGVPDGKETRLEIDAAGPLTITVQFSFEAEKRRAFELEQQAEAADKEGRLGEAIALRGKILEEFPFETALVERNQKKRDDRLAQGQKAVQRLDKKIADAELFRIPDGFREAKREAEALVTSYSGTDVAERAKGIIDKADASLSVTEAERGERDAERLNTIAGAFAKIQANDFAAYIRAYILKHFPGTKAAKSLGGK